MSKGFEEGHPYYPPRQIGKGLGRAVARRRSELGLAVRDRLPAETLVEFHVQRACGRRAYLDDSQDEIVVRIDTQGMAPSDEMVADSIRWLSDRGWGTPVQSVALAAHITRTTADEGVPFDPSSLPPAAALLMAKAFATARAARQLEAAKRATPIIDAASTEVSDPAPITRDQGPDPAPIKAPDPAV